MNLHEWRSSFAGRLDSSALVRVVVAFGAVALAVAWLSPVLDDEGYLAFNSARYFAGDPLAFAFLQKFHPTLSVMNALPAALGWNAYLLVHVVVAAAALLLFGRVVDRWGGPGWFAAALLALSPTYLVSAAAGHSNSDGFFFLALGLWLLTSERPRSLAAGVVFALSLWTRYEQAPFALGIVAFAGLLRRDWRLVAGFGATVVTYVAAGALYHADPLWLLTYPPNPPELTPGVSTSLRSYIRLDGRFLEQVFSSVGLGVAVWPLAAWAPWKASPPLARLFLAVGWGLAALMVVLPVVGLFNFEHTPRYLFVFAPALAAGAALALSSPVDRRAGQLVTCGVVVAAGALLGARAFTALLPFGAVALLALAPARRPLAVLLLSVGLLGTAATTDVRRGLLNLPTTGHAETLAWLAANPPTGPGAVIFDATMERLEPYARRAGLDLPLRFVASSDMTYEALRLTNATTGQYDRLLAALRRVDQAVFMCELVRGAPREGDLVVVLAENWRSDTLLSPAVWEPVTELLVRFGAFDVRRVLPGAEPPHVAVTRTRRLGPGHPSWEGPCRGR